MKKGEIWTAKKDTNSVNLTEEGRTYLKIKKDQKVKIKKLFYLDNKLFIIDVQIIDFDGTELGLTQITESDFSSRFYKTY
jgi:hypothetical protein